MTQIKNTKKSFLASVAFSTFLMANTADASTVRIINNSNDNMQIYVVPGVEGAPYCWKCFDSSLNSCGKSTTDIVVPREAFKGCEYFSVIDVSNGFMGSGKCKNLNLSKNYEISFSNTFWGTKCVCKEIL